MTKTLTDNAGFPLKRFTVMMTDYETFAATFNCQRSTFGHRETATILSRTKKLSPRIIAKIKRRLELYGVNTMYFDLVDQSDCSERQYNEKQVVLSKPWIPDFNQKTNSFYDNAIIEKDDAYYNTW